MPHVIKNLAFKKLKIYFFAMWHQIIDLKNKWTCHEAICYFATCHILRPSKMNDVDIFKNKCLNYCHMTTHHLLFW